MSGLRSWAASVIAAAVLAGVMEAVLPKHRFEKSVKVLLTLFLLVSFLSPLLGSASGPQRLKSGLDNLLDQYEAQQALEQTVRQTLAREIETSVAAFAAENGFSLESVKARVTVDANHKITVDRIEIIMAGTMEQQRELNEFVFDSFSVQPVIQMRDSHELQTE